MGKVFTILTILAATGALASESARRGPAPRDASPLKEAGQLKAAAPSRDADALPIEPPTPPPRPGDLPAHPPAAAPAAAQTPATPPPVGPADACLIELAGLGADAPRAEAPAASDSGCVIETPVRLKSVTIGGARIYLHGEPLIACATARVAALYLAQTVAPLAKGATGQALTGLNAAGFECRPRNRQPGAKMSAHGKGLALDVMSFQFADGATMTVAAPGERLAFLNGARKAACGYFTTVLGPGADEAHREHLHLDIEPHGSSGYGRICQ